MTYLFLGEDSPSKDLKIAELKKKIFSSAEALPFDQDIFYGRELNADTLKKALLSLPAVSSKRFIIIKECHRLSPRVKDVIVEFTDKPSQDIILVLDSDSLAETDAFVQRLKENSKVVNFTKPPQLNVFALTRAIEREEPTEALKILGDLTGQGVHPLQIIGGLVWFWSKIRPQIPLGNFQRGLEALQQADFNIKRSRLKPEHAVELLVVKLCLEKSRRKQGLAVSAG